MNKNFNTRLISFFILGLIVGSILVLVITFYYKSYQKTCTEYTSSETKALCDRNNFCRDYIMYYKDNKLVDIEPTEYTLQK